MDPKKDDPVRTAVKLGFQDAIADPETWIAIRVAFKSYAKTEAGGVAFGILGEIGKWALRGAIFIGAMYYIGGWSAVFAWFKSGGGK